MSRRLLPIAVVLAMGASACSGSTSTADQPPSNASAVTTGSEESMGAEQADGDDAALPSGPPASIDPADIPRGEARDFGSPPPIPDGALAPDSEAAIETLLLSLQTGLVLGEEKDAMRTLGASGDPRIGWILSDVLRLVRDATLRNGLTEATGTLLGREFNQFDAWDDVTDHLIAWDVPAPPDYVKTKRDIYTLVEPKWEPLFEEGADVDWRPLSWGGVLIDDRPFDTTDDQCNCIPAADNPPVSSADEAGWLADDAVVFGVEINGETRAYPRRIMEVREMVNDTLGGRDFGMPYCTLCGAAQVWFTDELPSGVERPVLRTSGLLTRSNKVMYDLTTFSMLDTFLGTALTGPLAEIDFQLDGHTVVTSTWGEWKAQHPDTTVLVEELALGRDFDFRNGRDADGPIFPVGDVDPRLPTQDDVIGVTTAAGTPLAFHVDTALGALRRGEVVEAEGVRLLLKGSGLRAVTADGTAEVVAHQAFWFAWSQFHPDTALWPAST